MESIRIILDLEETGFTEEDHTVSEISTPLIIGGMAKGTVEGKPVVMLGIQIDKNEYLVKQTTLSLFLSAADALKAKYGDPRT